MKFLRYRIGFYRRLGVKKYMQYHQINVLGLVQVYSLVTRAFIII